MQRTQAHRNSISYVLYYIEHIYTARFGVYSKADGAEIYYSIHSLYSDTLTNCIPRITAHPAIVLILIYL